MRSREKFFIGVSISVILDISMLSIMVIISIVSMLIYKNCIFSMLLHHI